MKNPLNKKNEPCSLPESASASKQKLISVRTFEKKRFEYSSYPESGAASKYKRFLIIYLFMSLHKEEPEIKTKSPINQKNEQCSLPESASASKQK
jgi:hypothetical protein